jgi:hypothetical protein
VDEKRTREETAQRYNYQFITSIIRSMSLCSIIKGAMGIIFSILLAQAKKSLVTTEDSEAPQGKIFEARPRDRQQEVGPV